MNADPTRNQYPIDAFESVSRLAHKRDDHCRLHDRQWHWTALVGAIAVLIGCLLVDVNGDGNLSLHGVPSVHFPIICPMRRFLGIPCPACGLTRSVVHMLQGRPSESFAAHRLGSLVLAAILFQVPYRTWCLTGRRGLPISPRIVELALAGFLFLLVLNWLVP
jgi:uncharacterized protein DUF2752